MYSYFSKLICNDRASIFFSFFFFVNVNIVLAFISHYFLYFFIVLYSFIMSFFFIFFKKFSQSLLPSLFYRLLVIPPAYGILLSF